MADTIKQGGTVENPKEPQAVAPDVSGDKDKEHGAEPPKADIPEVPPKDGKPAKTAPPKKDDVDKKPPEAVKPPIGGKDDKGNKVEPPKKKQKREPRPPDGSQRGKGETVGGDTTADALKAAGIKVESPEPPRDAPRSGVKEEIVQIPHAELFAFKDHPFSVRNDEAMKNLVESVKERGVDQPALVRPREGGGYEIVAGHRRQNASEQAGYATVPCIVRNMTDEEAILAMTETNFNQRDNILPSERARALKMQLEAIKRQGARFDGVAKGDVGKRSNEIIAERRFAYLGKPVSLHLLPLITPDLRRAPFDFYA